MTRLRILVGLVLLGAATASAQSIPPVTKSKAAARKAVDATNAHTAAMTAEPKTALEAQRAAGDSGRTAGSGRATGSAAGSTAVPSSTDAARSDTAFRREVFSYAPSGRRDPFVSLMANGELMPVITDLRVKGILYDAKDGNSVAMLIDASTKEEYRVRTGMTIGRMRVARITKKTVTFTIEEFGFSRQETLALSDPTKEKGQ